MKYRALFPEASIINSEIISPAPEKLILKYTEQDKVFIEETPEMYEKVTKPFFDR